jgi:ribosomal protein S18 acetylase RimI-like enzyme
MQVSSHALDGQHAVYILTLGVDKRFQSRGLAMDLLRMVYQHALDAG